MRSTRLAVGALAVLGTAYGVLVGALGRPSLALAPLAVAVACALLLGWRRSRRGGAGVGDAERLLRVLAGSLVPGVALGGVLRPFVGTGEFTFAD